MEKRLIIFLILSVLVIFSYPIIIEKLYGPVNQGSQKTEVEKEIKAEVPPSPTAAIQNNTAVTPQEKKEKIIETDLYRVVLSGEGGTIKKWELKRFTNLDPAGREHPIELIPENGRTLPLELIGSPDLPMGRNVLYGLDETPLHLDKERPDGIVEMVFKTPAGTSVTKRLHFHNDQYLVDLDIDVEGLAKGVQLSLGTNFGIEDWGQQFGGSVGAISLIDQQIIKNTPTKISGTLLHEGKATWLALQDKYFISALIPRDPEKVGPVSIRKEGDKEIVSEIQIPPVGGKMTTRFTLYAGPKEYDRLAALRIQLEESIDFGWFIAGSWAPVRIVAKPIFYLLRFIYRFSHNYGVAIILVTVLVTSLFFPITRKSLISMRAMAEVQPKIAVIKKKWGNDKEKMNRELMTLYKEHRINPLGGCLPMLVQIPVFIALFNILYTTIELRHAPFFLWILDLSDKDPYYVLPIIMGITMFFQQLTQPTSMDPTQAKVMLFLPVIYTFFFLKFPSGLVLYWLVNNLLSIGQQYLMKREGAMIPKPGAA